MKASKMFLALLLRLEINLTQFHGMDNIGERALELLVCDQPLYPVASCKNKLLEPYHHSEGKASLPMRLRG